MTSSGKKETEKLEENLKQQLDRLVQQLNDLESCKDELDSKEYEETKQETVEQLKEFQESLPRFAKGNVSLISSVESIQLATQEAISKAFKTPEVIKFFGKQEPDQLREKLRDIERNLKLGKTSKDMFNVEKVKLLLTLRQLGDKLAENELQFLQEHSTSDSMKNIEFEKISED